jgi:hypothetical protein
VQIKHKLLTTTPDQVPHEFAQAVIDFAKQLDVITAAYVGMTEITEDFHQPRRQLAAGFVLDSEDVETVQLVADTFEKLPAEVQEGGCNVLDGPGIAIWAKQAQEVFSR